MSTTRHCVYTDRLPPDTLCLLRRRMKLSRELADDVVRARGCVTQVCRADNSLARTTIMFDNILQLEQGWFSYGVLAWETPYANGKRHGVERWWYKNGVCNSEAVCVNGERVMAWRIC